LKEGGNRLGNYSKKKELTFKGELEERENASPEREGRKILIK